MGLSEDCKACLYRRQQEEVQKQKQMVELKKREYLLEVKQLIANAEQEDTAPVVTERISELHEKYFQSKYSFEELKRTYNQMMLEKEASIREEIESAKDPLKTAILYARVGNYIDFGALGSVDNKKLEELLGRVQSETLDEKEYIVFQKKLAQAKQLVYLTDNCGEILLDKLFIEQMKKTNPDIQVTVIVRGKSVLNDATIEDAKMVGLTELAQVYGNGTGIAGTSLKHITPKTKEMMESADLIISKGQGNFETLNHCGLTVFYLFLCKCSWFVKRFGLKQYTGVFIQDQNLK